MEDEQRFNFCLISAAAAAAADVGVEDKQRVNFGFAASTRNRRKSHSGFYLTF